MSLPAIPSTQPLAVADVLFPTPLPIRIKAKIEPVVREKLLTPIPMIPPVLSATPTNCAQDPAQQPRSEVLLVEDNEINLKVWGSVRPCRQLLLVSTLLTMVTAVGHVYAQTQTFISNCRQWVGGISALPKAPRHPAFYNHRFVFSLQSFRIHHILIHHPTNSAVLLHFLTIFSGLKLTRSPACRYLHARHGRPSLNL